MDQLTKTEKAIMRFLADGQPHHKRAIHENCCGPSHLVNVQRHISNLNKKIRPGGFEIVNSLLRRQIHYRLVRLVASPYDGRT